MKRFGLSKRGILVIIQSGVSAGLLGFLVSKVNIGRAGSAAFNADMLFLFGAILQLSAHPFLTALRWEIVARVLGGVLRFPAALRFVWIGAFFSQLLPASVGGDVVRIWLYGVHCGSHRLSIHSVALERLVMVLVLLLFVLAVQPGLAARGAPPSIVVSAAVVLTVILASLAALLIFNRLLVGRDSWLPFRLIAGVASDVRGLFSNIPCAAALCALSLAAHLNMVITAWLIAHALGLSVTLSDCVVLIPVIVLVSMLPISVGGWGVRESVMVGLFGLIGISSSDSLALSVLLGLAGIAVAIPGAFVWFIRVDRSKARTDLEQPLIGRRPD